MEQFIILSAEQSGLSKDQNNAETTKLEFIISSMGLDYEKVHGKYNEVEEESFIIYDPKYEYIKVLRNIAFYEFNQECVLINNDGGLYLDYSSGKVEHYNNFTEVLEIQAKHNKLGYSRIGDKYYILA